MVVPLTESHNGCSVCVLFSKRVKELLEMLNQSGIAKRTLLYVYICVYVYIYIYSYEFLFN